MEEDIDPLVLRSHITAVLNKQPPDRLATAFQRLSLGSVAFQGAAANAIAAELGRLASAVEVRQP